jgi:hypothetical protein
MNNLDYAEWVPLGKLVKSILAMFVSLELFVSFTILYFEPSSIERLGWAWNCLDILAFIGFLKKARSFKSFGNKTLNSTHGPKQDAKSTGNPERIELNNGI